MKKIGLYGFSVGENSFGVGKAYLQFVQSYGVPRILTPDNVFDDSIDMLILTGGADINPSSYGEAPNYFTGNTDVFKQYVYDVCLPRYVEAGVPIFGICLGFQQLASYFGSKITQHMPYHPTSDSRSKKAHTVTPENAGEFYKSQAIFDVNSFHHQGVVRRDLSEELVPVAYAKNEQYDPKSTEMEIIESFIHPTLPVAAVQWHPEDMYTHFVPALIHYILNKQIL